MAYEAVNTTDSMVGYKHENTGERWYGQRRIWTQRSELSSCPFGLAVAGHYCGRTVSRLSGWRALRIGWRDRYATTVAQIARGPEACVAP